jgi:hypothetical protein
LNLHGAHGRINNGPQYATIDLEWRVAFPIPAIKGSLEWPLYAGLTVLTIPKLKCGCLELVAIIAFVSDLQRKLLKARQVLLF